MTWRSAPRAALRAEPHGVRAALDEVRLELGDTSEQRGRHRDPVLHQDALLDDGLRPVFLHEGRALLIGKSQAEIAGRREVREHLAVR
jgi:hypothetical protein